MEVDEVFTETQYSDGQKSPTAIEKDTIFLQSGNHQKSGKPCHSNFIDQDSSSSDADKSFFNCQTDLLQGCRSLVLQLAESAETEKERSLDVKLVENPTTETGNQDGAVVLDLNVSEPQNDEAIQSVLVSDTDSDSLVLNTTTVPGLVTIVHKETQQASAAPCDLLKVDEINYIAVTTDNETAGVVGDRLTDDMVCVKENGLLLCRLCDYSTDKRANWYKHRVVHQEGRYKCPECSYKSKTTSNLQRHMLIHRDVRQHKCHLCDQQFRQKIHLARHLRYKHLAKSVRCHLCDFVCANTSPDLMQHMKRRHKNAPVVSATLGSQLAEVSKLSCDKCSFTTMSQKDLKQHMKFHKQGSEVKFFCEKCSFVTDCKSRLTRHLLVHSKDKPFACSQCSYRATQKEHVVRHVRVKHRKDSSSESPQSSAATDHDDMAVTVKGEMSISSDARLIGNKPPAKKRGNTSDSSNQHKYFACNFCTMKFTKLLNLHKHVHVQHQDLYALDENQFSCVMCNYTSSNRKNLLVHMRKHAYFGDKSMYTEVCVKKDSSLGGVSKALFQPAGTKVPMKEKFTCVLCDFSSEFRDVLYNHMCEAHNLQIITQDEAHDATTTDLINQLSSETEAAVTALDLGSSNDATFEATPGSNTTKVLVQLLPGGPVSAVEINRPSSSSSSFNLEQMMRQDNDQTSLLGVLAEPTSTDDKDAKVPESGHSDAGVTQVELATPSTDQIYPGNIEGLTHGDLIEINGDVYKVELTDDQIIKMVHKSS